MTPPGFDPDTIATGSQIGLNVANASPPTDAYVSQDDYLYIGFSTSLASGTINVTARILMPDGRVVPSVWPVQMTFSRAIQTIRIPFPEGFLLSCAVLLANTAAPRSTYVSLAISRSTLAPTLLGNVLVQGYADSNVPLSWPGGILSTNLDCAGNIRVITGTLPAAGVQISETVPANARWNLLSITFSFTASATVATRLIQLILDDGTNVYGTFLSPASVTAGLSLITTFAVGVTTTTNATSQMIAIVSPAILSAGFRIRTNVLNMQAGDQLTAPVYQVEEWIVP